MREVFYKALFPLFILILAKPLCAGAVTLQAGTFIPVRLAQNINGSINNTGDKVHFQVIDDILVDNQVVIAKHSWVNGKVSYAKGRGMVGNGGRVSVIASSVEAVDGQIVRIERDPLSSEGRTRTANTITNVALWGALGLMSKGRAAGIFIDSEFELEVAESVEITTAPPPTPAVPDPKTATAVTGSFEKSGAPIRFHNGVIGKDFVLTFNLPDADSLQAIPAERISITEVYGHPLPQPIHPRSADFDSKRKRHTATFDFWEVVQYCTPLENNIKFEISLTDGSVAAGTTSLNRKWKLK